MPPFELLDLDEVGVLPEAIPLAEPEPQPETTLLAAAFALGWTAPLLTRGNRLHLARADGATHCGLRGEPLYLQPPPVRLCRRCARLHRFTQPVAGNWHLATRLEVCERETLVGALHAAEGNRIRAAKALGVSRATLYRLLNEHKLTDRRASTPLKWRWTRADAG